MLLLEVVWTVRILNSWCFRENLQQPWFINSMSQFMPYTSSTLFSSRSPKKHPALPVKEIHSTLVHISKQSGKSKEMSKSFKSTSCDPFKSPIIDINIHSHKLQAKYNLFTEIITYLWMPKTGASWYSIVSNYKITWIWKE